MRRNTTRSVVLGLTVAAATSAAGIAVNVATEPGGGVVGWLLVAVCTIVLGVVSSVVDHMLSAPPPPPDPTRMAVPIAYTYQSGTKPGRYNALPAGCTAGPCPPSPVLVWRVPRGAAVTTVFAVKRGRSRLPFRSVAGFVKIDGCSSARLEVTVRAGDPPRTLRAVGRAGGFPLQGRLRGRLPAEVTSLSLTFRRLDRSACTAEVHLQNPTVTRDQLFDIRNRFG